MELSMLDFLTSLSVSSTSVLSSYGGPHMSLLLYSGLCCISVLNPFSHLFWWKCKKIICCTLFGTVSQKIQKCDIFLGKCVGWFKHFDTRWTW